MHKIRFGRGSALDSARSFQTPNRVVMELGHLSLRFLPLDAASTPSESRSRPIPNEVVIVPRDNGFPSPAMALDEPGHHCYSWRCQKSRHEPKVWCVDVENIKESKSEDQLQLRPMNSTGLEFRGQILVAGDERFMRVRSRIAIVIAA